MLGQRIGYIRVSTLDQHVERQLEGIEVDKTNPANTLFTSVCTYADRGGVAEGV